MAYKTYKRRSAASVKQQSGVFKAWAQLSWWHSVTSIAPSQPPSLLEIIESGIKLRRKRLQWKSRKAGFLLPAELLMTKLLYSLRGFHRSSNIVTPGQKIMHCHSSLQISHTLPSTTIPGWKMLSLSDYCHALPGGLVGQKTEAAGG